MGMGFNRKTLVIFTLLLLILSTPLCEGNENSENNSDLQIKIDDWIFLLPAFLGYFLFLCWLSRFFDKMKTCFLVTFMLSFIILGAFLLNLLLPNWDPKYLPVIGNISILNEIPAFVFGYLLILLLLLIALGIILSVFTFLCRKLFKVEIWSPQGINEMHMFIRNFIIIISVFAWPFIAIYYSMINQQAPSDQNYVYVTPFGNDELKFPIYVIIGATIGVLSYLLLSITELFGELLPEYKKKSIAWAYIRRILIAPYIAIAAFYLLTYLRLVESNNNANSTFIFLFAFFTGAFTKIIEDWIYDSAKKILPEEEKNKILERKQYNVEKSDFVRILEMEPDLAHNLYSLNVRTIDELANCDPEKLTERLKRRTEIMGETQIRKKEMAEGKFDAYSEKVTQLYICRARKCLNLEISDFVSKLGIKRNQAYALKYYANLKTVKNLASMDIQIIHQKLCSCSEKEIQETMEAEKCSHEEAHEKICEYTIKKLEKIRKKAENFIENAKEKRKRKSHR